MTVDVADVVSSLASDYSSSGLTFEEFCAEFDYDTDSRKAERTWRAVQDQGKHFERWLPDPQVRQKLMEAEHWWLEHLSDGRKADQLSRSRSRYPSDRGSRG